MTTYPAHTLPVSKGPTLKQIADKVLPAAKVGIMATYAFVTSLVSSILGVLGLGSFVVAAFLVNPIVGFVVLGISLLVLDKAVKRERA